MLVPDRDKPGMAHMEQVAAAHPGCQWLFPFPNTAEWNGSMPSTGGLDIADRIQTGATVDHILKGIGDKPVAEPTGEAQGDLDASRKDALKALSKAAERIYLDREIAPMERLVHLRAVASDLDVRLRDSELQRFIWDVRRRLNGISDGYGPDDYIETPDDQWLHHGLLLAEDSNLIVGLPKANKTTYVLGTLEAICKDSRSLGRI